MKCEATFAASLECGSRQ